MNDFTKYEQMRDRGLSPEEVYAEAKFQEGDSLKGLWLIRRLFGVSLPQARTIIERGETLFFQKHVLPVYEKLRDAGLSPHQIYQATASNGVTSEIERLKII